MKIITILAWLACSVVDYGGTYTNYINSFPTFDSPRERRDDAGIAATFALGGPLALPAVALGTGFFYDGLQFSGGPREKEGQE